MRVSFVGASGTGKSTLMRMLLEDYPNLEVNPVGSRSTAKAMGFLHPAGHPQAGEGNPYAVDRARVDVYLNQLAMTGDPVSSAESAVAMFDQRPGSRTCRAIFQTRLQAEKIAWETSHTDFVSDRTTLDDMAYAVMHCRDVVDAEFMDRAFAHMKLVDTVFYCPLSVFQDLDGDASRVPDLAYHRVYDALVSGFLDQYTNDGGVCRRLNYADLPWRRRVIRDLVLLDPSYVPSIDGPK